MKAILEFNLPEEEDDHADAMNGWKYRHAIDNVLDLIRNKLKHGHSYKHPDEVLEDIRKSLLEEMP